MFPKNLMKLIQNAKNPTLFIFSLKDYFGFKAKCLKNTT